jgi:hypothetical protein
MIGTLVSRGLTTTLVSRRLTTLIGTLVSRGLMTLMRGLTTLSRGLTTLMPSVARWTHPPPAPCLRALCPPRRLCMALCLLV